MTYYRQFPTAIRHLRVHSIVLLTLSPLTLAGSFDLHVLAMPPAFILSHDQTLQLNSLHHILSNVTRYSIRVCHVSAEVLSDPAGLHPPFRSRFQVDTVVGINGFGCTFRPDDLGGRPPGFCTRMTIPRAVNPWSTPPSIRVSVEWWEFVWIPCFAPSR